MAEGDKKEREKAPYARYAFANAYSLSLIAGAGAVAAVTGNWMLGVAAAGAEALWMLFAPDSRLLRKLWFDKRHAQLEAERDEARLQLQIAGLVERDQKRCVALR